MSQWTNKVDDVQSFLGSIENQTKCTLGKAAIEIGLYEANREIEKIYKNIEY